MGSSTGAIDYAILQNERKVQNGMAPLYMDPYNLVDANGDRITGFGTDWPATFSPLLVAHSRPYLCNKYLHILHALCRNVQVFS